LRSSTFRVGGKLGPQQIVQVLDAYRDARDWWTETFFTTVYGSPMVQAMVGLRSDDAAARRRIGRDVTREAAARKMAAEIEAHVERGGVYEAVVRALLYIGLGSPHPAVDERAFAVLPKSVLNIRRAVGRAWLSSRSWSKSSI
jgi:hypothetical protein